MTSPAYWNLRRRGRPIADRDEAINKIRVRLANGEGYMTGPVKVFTPEECRRLEWEMRRAGKIK